jgi:hypothetical protein
MILMHVAGAATPGRASSACRLPLHDRAWTAGVWPAALGRRASPAAGIALTGGAMRAAEVWPAVLGQSSYLPGSVRGARKNKIRRTGIVAICSIMYFSGRVKRSK